MPVRARMLIVSSMLYTFAAALPMQSAHAQAAKDAAKDLPAWKVPEICAKDSARDHCLILESDAWRTVSGSWVAVPDPVKAACLDTLKSPADNSWRGLADCLDEQFEKRIDKRAVATRYTPAEPVPPAKNLPNIGSEAPAPAAAATATPAPPAPAPAVPAPAAPAAAPKQ